MKHFFLYETTTFLLLCSFSNTWVVCKQTNKQTKTSKQTSCAQAESIFITHKQISTETNLSWLLSGMVAWYLWIWACTSYTESPQD